MPFLEKSLGTNSKFRERCGSFEHPFSVAGRVGKADGFVQKKTKFSSKSNPRERCLWRREFRSAIYYEFS